MAIQSAVRASPGDSHGGADEPATIVVILDEHGPSGSPDSGTDESQLLLHRHPESATPAELTENAGETSAGAQQHRIVIISPRHGQGWPQQKYDTSLCYLQHLGTLYSELSLAASTAQRKFWDCGAALMLLAALLSSMGALSVALIDGRVPVFEIVLIRSGVSFLISLLVAAAQKLPSWAGSRALRPLFAIRGFVGMASMTLYYEAINCMPLADAMTIMYSNPVACALLAWLMRGERLGWQGCAGIAGTLLGVVFVSEPPFLFGGHAWSHMRLVGTVLAIGAAVTTALAFLAVGAIPKSEPALIVAMWFHGSSLLTAAVALTVGYPDKAVLIGRPDAALLMVISLASFFGQMFLNRSFQIITAAKGSSIMCTQVLYAHIFGVLLGQPETLWGVVGAVLIACGVVSVNRTKSGLPAVGVPTPGNAKGSALDERGHILYTPLTWQSGLGAPVGAALAHMPAAAQAPGDEGSIAALRHERQVPGQAIPCTMPPLKGGIFLGQARNSSCSGALLSSSPEWAGLELQERSLSAADGGSLQPSSSSPAGTVVPGEPFSTPAEQEAGVPVEATAGQLPLGRIAQPLQGVSRQGRTGVGRGQTLRDREQSWTGEWVFDGRRAADAPSRGAHYSQIREQDSL